MNKFNIESAKFVSIIIGICFIFIMVVWHAFNYLPAKDTNNLLVNEATETEANNLEEVSREETDSSESEIQEELNNEEEVRYIEQDIPKLEPVLDENNEVNIREVNKSESVSSLESSLNKAKEYIRENNTQSAISEYQKAISLADDLNIKAECYEEIALLYAQSKRYGSALSAAQKAYNTAPSTSREVLLARLYYKTGDIDKATNRVNNILRRDFILNDK